MPETPPLPHFRRSFRPVVSGTFWDNGDETLSCEGGYSDGSSAAGTTIKVQDPKGKVIFTGKLDKNGELTFKKPKGEFTVTFDGGPGHSVTIKSSNIK